MQGPGVVYGLHGTRDGRTAEIGSGTQTANYWGSTVQMPVLPERETAARLGVSVDYVRAHPEAARAALSFSARLADHGNLGQNSTGWLGLVDSLTAYIGAYDSEFETRLVETLLILDAWDKLSFTNRSDTGFSPFQPPRFIIGALVEEKALAGPFALVAQNKVEDAVAAAEAAVATLAWKQTTSDSKWVEGRGNLNDFDRIDIDGEVAGLPPFHSNRAQREMVSEGKEALFDVCRTGGGKKLEGTASVMFRPLDPLDLGDAAFVLAAKKMCLRILIGKVRKERTWMKGAVKGSTGDLYYAFPLAPPTDVPASSPTAASSSSAAAATPTPSPTAAGEEEEDAAAFMDASSSSAAAADPAPSPTAAGEEEEEGAFMDAPAPSPTAASSSSSAGAGAGDGDDKEGETVEEADGATYSTYGSLRQVCGRNGTTQIGPFNYVLLHLKARFGVDFFIRVNEAARPKELKAAIKATLVPGEADPAPPFPSPELAADLFSAPAPRAISSFIVGSEITGVFEARMGGHVKLFIQPPRTIVGTGRYWPAQAAQLDRQVIASVNSFRRRRGLEQLHGGGASAAAGAAAASSSSASSSSSSSSSSAPAPAAAPPTKMSAAFVAYFGKPAAQEQMPQPAQSTPAAASSSSSVATGPKRPAEVEEGKVDVDGKPHNKLPRKS
jgi:hypothetical protein